LDLGSNLKSKLVFPAQYNMSNEFAAMLFSMMPVTYMRNFGQLMPARVQAVREWQQEHNLTVQTGVCGNRDCRSLKKTCIFFFLSIAL
jgi:hypothetical protein